VALLARRPRLIAAVAVAAVACLALAGLVMAPRKDAVGRALGPRMAIDLVTPPTPDIMPGSILEVGQVNDGFDDAALEPVAETADPTFLPEDAYTGPAVDLADVPRMPPPRTIATEAAVQVQAAPAPDRDVLDDGSRWFGLDQLDISTEPQSTKD
jgi:hypothetical protein